MDGSVWTMAGLDAMDADAFLAAVGDLFEHSPWVMAPLAALRPFGSARALHDAAMQVVRQAPEDAVLDLLRAHPELAGQEAAADALTQDSAGEQGRLGFTRLSPAEHAELAALNARYLERFGFPCIVALCRHAARDTVFTAFRTRLLAAPEAERAVALHEIGFITEARLAARLGRSGGGLSLHALDTMRGGGAAGLAYALSRREAGAWRLLATGRTTEGGRTEEPLLLPLDLEPGAYRIEYQVAAYHRAQGIALPDPPFLDVVPILFGVADPAAHHHVPLQFTPWSYATYRGS